MVDHVRRPERPCQRKPRLVHVDRYNRLASGYFGSHQGRQADGARSEYRERISRFWPHRIKYGAGTGLSAAGEWSKELERGVFPDLHNVTFVGDDVSCERGLLEESAVDGGAVLAHEMEMDVAVADGDVEFDGDVDEAEADRAGPDGSGHGASSC